MPQVRVLRAVLEAHLYTGVCNWDQNFPQWTTMASCCGFAKQYCEAKHAPADGPEPLFIATATFCADTVCDIVKALY